MLKQIKYFQTVVRCGSFTKAAEECYISQSAISQQIQALEQELGVKLLERKNRRFSLTPAGEYFYEKSLTLTADYNRLLAETTRIAHRETPQLRLGCLKGYSGREFRQAVEGFAGLHPEVSIHIINGTHEELYEELISCRVDVVLSDQRRAFYEDYANYILATRACCIGISSRNPIAGRETVEVSELAQIPCILVASKNQRKNERNFYQERIGITSEFVFAENMRKPGCWSSAEKGICRWKATDRNLWEPRWPICSCCAAANPSTETTAFSGSWTAPQILSGNLGSC